MMTKFPEIEMWGSKPACPGANTPPPLDDAQLVRMIEASNAYAFCEFHDPVNEIYETMWREVAGYIPELLAIAVKAREGR